MFIFKLSVGFENSLNKRVRLYWRWRERHQLNGLFVSRFQQARPSHPSHSVPPTTRPTLAAYSPRWLKRNLRSCRAEARLYHLFKFFIFVIFAHYLLFWPLDYIVDKETHRLGLVCLIRLVRPLGRYWWHAQGWDWFTWRSLDTH